jgi:hypothetical protein
LSEGLKLANSFYASGTGKHFVSYREEAGGILISRILQERMLPEKQTMEDEVEH